MFGSRVAWVRSAIASAAAGLVAAGLFFSSGDSECDTSTRGEAHTEPVPAPPLGRDSAVEERRAPVLTADTPTPADGGEAPHRPGEVRTLPRWAREALELEEASEAKVLTNRESLGGGGELDPGDLAVLAEIISASGLDESSSPFDYDDGNGSFEPWEFGFQVWENGRLVLLATGPSLNFSFGYDLFALPESIGDLLSVRVLALHGSELRLLPDAIGSLRTLRELLLHDNRLAELPRAIGGLSELRELHLAGNDFSTLPRELGLLGQLETLNASDNPLTHIEEGALSLPRLQLLALERTRRPQHPGAAEWGQLRELPVELPGRALEELRIGGNLLYCVGGLPARYLTDGSISSVVGLGAQRCESVP